MKNILIVEDEEDLSRIVGSVFSDEGYKVRASPSAEEALLLCRQSKPDLIICDVKMGEMDGFTMLERLKVADELRNIPFIFLTAFDDSASVKRGLGLGADAYIIKPFDLDGLLGTVLRLVPPKLTESVRTLRQKAILTAPCSPRYSPFM